MSPLVEERTYRLHRETDANDPEETLGARFSAGFGLHVRGTGTRRIQYDADS